MAGRNTLERGSVHPKPMQSLLCVPCQSWPIESVTTSNNMAEIFCSDLTFKLKPLVILHFTSLRKFDELSAPSS